jgi:hypothetical protein
VVPLEGAEELKKPVRGQDLAGIRKQSHRSLHRPLLLCFRLLHLLNTLFLSYIIIFLLFFFVLLVILLNCREECKFCLADVLFAEIVGPALPLLGV